MGRLHVFGPYIQMAHADNPRFCFLSQHHFLIHTPGVSVRTAWTSWWATEPLTSWKMLIPGAATCVSRQSVLEISNSDQTGVSRFKTCLSTTAPWSLYVPHFILISSSHVYTRLQNKPTEIACRKKTTVSCCTCCYVFGVLILTAV